MNILKIKKEIHNHVINVPGFARFQNETNHRNPRLGQLKNVSDITFDIFYLFNSFSSLGQSLFSISR